MDSTTNDNQEVEVPSILSDAPASIDWELLEVLEKIHREHWESLSPASEAKVKEYHLEVAEWAREREAPMNDTWESETKYYETLRALRKDDVLNFHNYKTILWNIETAIQHPSITHQPGAESTDAAEHTVEQHRVLTASQLQEMRSGLRMAYMEKFDRGGAFVDSNGLRYDSLILFLNSKDSQDFAEEMGFTLEQLTSASHPQTTFEQPHPANTT